LNTGLQRRRRAERARAVGRAAVRPTPEALAMVRRHAQPAAVEIARLTVTAVLAYLAALPLPGTARPVIAPLTALGGLPRKRSPAAAREAGHMRSK
jgi:hypothetical protein